jgi:SAM-dependent methyltransferase
VSFKTQQEAWSNPPVDDVGYIPSSELLRLTTQELQDMIATFEETRYGGWRNYKNRWRELLGLDSTHGKQVLDYGCGVGIEALQYAKAGNDVVVADISRDNVMLALKVLNVSGFTGGSFQITEKNPINQLVGKFDIIHCVGVLHHIPNSVQVMEAFDQHLSDDGEVRLMLYSDIAKLHFGDGFLRAMDGVGDYADWYDIPRVEQRFGEWFNIKRYDYLTANQFYLGVVLEKK